MNFNSLDEASKLDFFAKLYLFLDDATECPITHEMMRDPVLLKGHLFEKKSIEYWLKSNVTHPITGESVLTKDLSTNKVLKIIFTELENNFCTNNDRVKKIIESDYYDIIHWLSKNNYTHISSEIKRNLTTNYDHVLFYLIAVKKKKETLILLNDYHAHSHSAEYENFFIERIIYCDDVSDKLIEIFDLVNKDETKYELLQIAHKKDIKLLIGMCKKIPWVFALPDKYELLDSFFSDIFDNMFDVSTPNVKFDLEILDHVQKEKSIFKKNNSRGFNLLMMLCELFHPISCSQQKSKSFLSERKKFEEKMIDLLKLNLIDINHSSSDGITLFYLACQACLTDLAFYMFDNFEITKYYNGGNGESEIIFLCYHKATKLALELIRKNSLDPSYVDEKGITLLVYTCFLKRRKIALELIKSGKSNLSYIDDNGSTALICACSNGLSKVSLEIIKTGKSNPSAVDFWRRTALIYACQKNMKEVALELIKTGNANPSFVDDPERTALIYACHKKMRKVALELIKTGNANPSCVDNPKRTALIYACHNKMRKVALELIKTCESKPSAFDCAGYTALIHACMNGMSDVALELIKTNDSRPSQINEKDDTTALINACKNKMTTVALALITTGESNPSCVDFDDCTALIYACKNKMDAVAVEIIKTGDSNYLHMDKRGKTASEYAIDNKLEQTLSVLAQINS
jgi:ankyrin repeat protein